MNFYSRRDQAVSDIVAIGGGEHIGTQEGHAWFNEPSSGSTTLIPLDMLSVDAVQERMAEMRATWEGKGNA
jgi:hypothetical protein